MAKFIKKRAFTLAEVLITLGIIGVVAAMTIPTLITNQRYKKFETNIKKVYSELNQVSKFYMNDYEETVPFGITTNHTNMKKLLITYIKGVTVIDPEKWDSTDEDGNLSMVANKKYKNFKGTSVYQPCDISGAYANMGGISISWNDSPKMGENGPVVCVDLNGSDKPNVAGIDYFLFLFTNDGTVIPMGMDHLDNTKTTSVASNFFLDKSYCGGSKNNYSCAYWAILDKSPKGNGSYWRDYLGKKLYK